SPGAVVNQFLAKNISSDVRKDLTPIATIAQYQVGVAVRADSPCHTIDDLITAARKHCGTEDTEAGGAPQHTAMHEMVELTRVRLLAVFTNRRIDDFNQAPTMQEAGFDIVAPSIFGLVGPKGMDPAIVRKLDDAFHHAMSTTAFKNCANQFGLMIDYRNAGDFARHIDNTAVQWGPAAAALKK